MSDVTAALPLNPSWTYKVTIGRTECTPRDAKGLEAIVVEDHVELIACAELSFGTLSPDWGAFDFGQDVRVELGEGDERAVFVGIVTDLRHVRRGGRERLVVIAMDPLVRLAATRKTRSFRDAADADVVQQVASGAGLNIRRSDSGQFARAYVLQRNESDLDLVRRIATRNGFVAYCDQGELVFGRPAIGATPLELGAADIRELDWTMSTRNVPNGMELHAWDPGAGEDANGVAASSDVPKIGEGTLSVGAPWTLWTERSHLSDVEVVAPSAAQSVAIAALERASWTFLRGRATVTGSPRLHADVRVKLRTGRSGFEPDVWVLGTRHMLEPGRAYTTELTFCSNTRPA